VGTIFARDQLDELDRFQHTRSYLTHARNSIGVRPRVEAGSNNCADCVVAVRVGKGTQFVGGGKGRGHNWARCAYGYKYGDLGLQVGGVPTGPESETVKFDHESRGTRIRE
jgi:hypothetical protein